MLRTSFQHPCPGRAGAHRMYPLPAVNQTQWKRTTNATAPALKTYIIFGLAWFGLVVSNSYDRSSAAAGSVLPQN